jgi:hypothetical protein
MQSISAYPSHIGIITSVDLLLISSSLIVSDFIVRFALALTPRIVVYGHCRSCVCTLGTSGRCWSRHRNVDKFLGLQVSVNVLLRLKG